MSLLPREKRKKSIVRAKSLSEIKEAKLRYKVRGKLESNLSIKELGIGADIERPEDLRRNRDVTHKTREFKEFTKKPSETVQISRSDIMVTPESILKHEQHINAIMIRLKPTLYSYFCKAIAKDDLKRFFNQIREEQDLIEKET